MQATYFGRDTRNLIEFVSCFGITPGPTDLCATPNQRQRRLLRQRRRAPKRKGVELQASWQADRSGSTFTANYTFDDVEDRSPGSPTDGLPAGAPARRTPPTSTPAIVWPIKLTHRDRASATPARASTTPPTPSRLKAYTLVDLRASYPLRESLELYGRIENLTDRATRRPISTGALGRAAYAGVRLTF